MFILRDVIFLVRLQGNSKLINLGSKRVNHSILHLTFSCRKNWILFTQSKPWNISGKSMLWKNLEVPAVSLACLSLIFLLFVENPCTCILEWGRKKHPSLLKLQQWHAEARVSQYNLSTCSCLTVYYGIQSQINHTTDSMSFISSPSWGYSTSRESSRG